MFKKLEYIATIPKETPSGYTSYFFNRDDRLLLPIEFETQNIEYLVCDGIGHAISNQHLASSTKTIINALGGKLVAVSILNNAQAYLEINTLTTKRVSVICRLFDAIALGSGEHVTYQIDSAFLEENGIRITKEIIDSFVLS